MALLEICTYPDPVLRCKASPVDCFDAKLRKLIDDMAETMYDAPGIGLAAPQVGVSARLVVIDLQREDDEHGLIVLVNPEIISRGEEDIVWEEGCLSVPDFFARVKRSGEVVVRAQDKDGNPFEITGTDLMAVALQHELDHLEGTLFVDRMGPMSKDLFRRRMKKLMREDDEDES